MLVVRVSKRDGLYREVQIDNWTDEKDQLLRNGEFVTEGLTEEEIEFILTGDVTVAADPIPEEATEVVAPKRKAKVEQSVVEEVKPEEGSVAS